MKTLSLDELRKVMHSGRVSEFEDLLPVQISVQGEPKFILDRVENVVALSDIHPRMQIRIRALERLARAGMVKPDKLNVKEIIKTPIPIMS